MSSIPNLIYTIAVWLLPVLFAITLHEVAHGYVASLLGDKTAKNLGRLTINPLKHVDPVGTIVVPMFMAMVSPFVMGWAKPVPVNPQNFKSPLLDMALVAVAGPVSNLFMACFWALFIVFSRNLLDNSQVLIFLTKMGEAGMLINILLMVLNLLPIPPLDGGRVVAGILPKQLALPFIQLERFGMMIVILLLVSGVLGKILWPVMQHFMKIIGIIFGL
jgi:Zn-dependent protease